MFELLKELQDFRELNEDAQIVADLKKAGIYDQLLAEGNDPSCHQYMGSTLGEVLDALGIEYEIVEEEDGKE